MLRLFQCSCSQCSCPYRCKPGQPLAGFGRDYTELAGTVLRTVNGALFLLIFGSDCQLFRLGAGIYAGMKLGLDLA
jgi:hypothetical protein